MGNTCSTHGSYEKYTRYLVRKSEGKKKSLLRRRCRRENNIKMDVKYIVRLWTECSWHRTTYRLDKDRGYFPDRGRILLFFIKSRPTLE
jgi:hypothetical protein